MRYKTIQCRIDAGRDFKMSRRSVVVRNHRVVPDSVVDLTREVVDTETGEVVEGKVVKACRRLTVGRFEDNGGFVKHRRFRGLMGLSGQTLRLYCYMLEAMDQWGRVVMDYYDIEEYVGTRCHQQLSRSLKELTLRSLIKRTDERGERRGNGRWGRYTVLAATKMREVARDKSLGRFVKVYDPAVISALSRGGVMLLCYVMDRCGYDGLVELDCDGFLRYTQELLGKKGLRNRKSFYDARADLMSEKINILKPLYDLVEDGEGGVGFGCISGWYRISPNVCFVGNRAEAGYEVETIDN